MSGNTPATAVTAFDAYRVVRRLGGGMQGETFLAEAASGPGVVVVKAAHTAGPRARRAMDTEVAALRTVGPAFVPRVVDHRPDAERPYFVMEYLEGHTLDRSPVDGPLGQAGTRGLAIRLATLLAAVHEAGVAHGDLRGQNLIVARDGLYAIDFGCARLRDDSRREFRRRRQVDLLRLGMLIAQAGTGRAPFGDDWGKAIEDYHDGNLDLGSMSGTLRAVTRALLSNTAWKRPSSRTVRAVLLRG
jgi:serine/threonine protein kinase